MKLRLFQYAVLLHPNVTTDGKYEEKTKIIKDLTTLLAKDEKEVGLVAARAIPEEYVSDLDRVEIQVRPL